MWQTPLQDQAGFTIFFYLLYRFLYEVYSLAVIDHCKSEGTVSSAAGFLL